MTEALHNPAIAEALLAAYNTDETDSELTGPLDDPTVLEAEKAAIDETWPTDYQEGFSAGFDEGRQAGFDAAKQILANRDAKLSEATGMEVVLQLHGSVFHIGVVDPELATNEYLLASIARGIAGELQRNRIANERKLERLSDRARENMDRMLRDGDRIDIDTGDLQGLNTNQLEYYQNLESQVDLINAITDDLKAWYKQYNTYDKRKLHPRTDQDVRNYMAKWENGNDSTASAFQTAQKFIRDKRAIKHEVAKALNHHGAVVTVQENTQ